MDYIDKLNERYAVVVIGTKVRVADLGKRPFEFLLEEDFKRMYANCHDGLRSIAERWWKHRRRRQYLGGVEFAPGLEVPEDVLNLWQGFAVQPKPGDLQPFLGFVLNVICNGDEKLCGWLLAWLAHLCQHPSEPPGTALVLRGPQGAGKSFFAQTIAALLGCHAVEVCDPNHLIGRFNAHLLSRLLVVAEEAAYASKKASDKLKAMITSPKALGERKGMDASDEPNFVRVMILGNHERLINAANDERRYCVLDVSACRREDDVYFAGLAAWRDNGGLQALLHHLFHLDISGEKLRCAPRTKALGEQKLLGLRGIPRWWFDRLYAGDFDDGRPWEGPHRVMSLRDSYIESIGLRSDRGSETEFGRELRKLVPGLTRRRPKDGYVYVIPSLEECRRFFEEWLGQEIEWPESLDPAAE